MIYHVYWGTSGNSGLYLDEIYTVLAKVGYHQKAFVSRYYPFNYGEKVFFRYTDLGHGFRLGKLRNFVRYIELVAALIRIYVSVLIHKPHVLNFSLIGLYVPVLMFMKLIKKTNCKLVVTCHDVIPFVKHNIDKAMKMRADVFKMADYCLVHNDNSVQELVDVYGVEARKIVQHSFPIMDLNKIYDKGIVIKKKCDFLFLGHLRYEKGIDVLLKAWNLFHEKYRDASLCIVGNDPDGLDTTPYQHQNIDFELHFLSDEAYFEWASSASCIVLPYIRGTNSGVVSTLINMDVLIITSDIDMFRNNSLIDKNFMFSAGDAKDLCRVLEMVYTGNYFHNRTSEMIDTYREDFRKEVVHVYEKIMEDGQV